MNVTKRILFKGEHTFTYKGKEFSVESLINFCKDKPVDEAKLQVFQSLLSNTSINDIWAEFNETSGKVMPITLLDIAEHAKRIKDADTRYPIIVVRDSKKLTVLDGNHRLIKAYLEDKKTIPVVWLSPEDMNEFIARQ